MKLANKTAQFVPYQPITGEYRVRLDANESFLLPTESDREAMAAAAGAAAFNRYPDPLASEACGAFAALYGVDPALVTAGNGSDELISVLLNAFADKGDAILTLSPDFSMYAFYAAEVEARCLTLDKRPDMTIDIDAVIDTVTRERVRMLLFSNPCNPTSLGVPREEMRRLLRACPDTLIVADEAYMDFWDQSLLSEVTEYDNLIVLRTCSKALGLAALRLGFAVANPTLTGVLRAAKSPYNVNSVTQAMATIILKNPLYREEYGALLRASRDMLLAGMKELEAAEKLIRVYDSCTNFVYIETDKAVMLAEALADRGIAIRRFGDRHLRVTAGTEAENREVLAMFAFLLK